MGCDRRRGGAHFLILYLTIIIKLMYLTACRGPAAGRRGGGQARRVMATAVTAAPPPLPRLARRTAARAIAALAAPGPGLTPYR